MTASVAFEPAVETDNASAGAEKRKRIQAWIVVGGTAMAAVAVAVVLGLRFRHAQRAVGKSTPGSIDWRLSLLSDNRVLFRPTLVLGKGRQR